MRLGSRAGRKTAGGARRVAAVATLCLLAPFLSAALGAGPPAAAHTEESAASAASPAPTGRVANDRGRWFVRPAPGGDRLVWRSPSRLPITDARPEFRVGSHVVGYPRLAADGRSLSLPAASLRRVDPAHVSVWLGLRRLDRTTHALPPSVASTAGTPEGRALPEDPATPGPFATQSFDYSAADLPWPAFDAPMEVLGHAVLPVGVKHAPLVLFLHGRHIACYGIDDPGFWPCVPGSRPVPSYLGYVYLQKLLASQGYATVSISANAVNAQDGNTNDGGAEARATLVRHHLELLAAWSSGSGHPRWSGRLDMSHVVLVGHSRGGEGVDQAAIDTDASAPYHLSGQVLIAPTDFSYQTAPYLPTELLLGYCDGDVSDLQGQRYVDAEPLLAPDDPTLRSSVLLFGANHNYFNTEWTPGISKAPSEDDWWDSSDPTCGTASSTRLTAAQQRRAAMTFVAAGVHAFLGDEVRAALEYLDSPGPVAVPQAGPAVALTAALGGRRHTVRLGAGAAPAGAAEPCLAGQPASNLFLAGAPRAQQPPLCGLPDYYRQPHWTPAASFPASVHAAYAQDLPQQLMLSWDDRSAAGGGLTLAQPFDLAASRASLDLRVVVDPRSGPVQLRVVLGSAGRLHACPVVTLSPLPGSSWLSALWAQTVRVRPAEYRGDVNLSKVDTVLLRPVGGTGRVWLLDASVRHPGLAAAPDESLPRIRLGRVAWTEGGPGSTGEALLPFRVFGTVQQPGRLAVAADQSTWSDSAEPEFETVTVEPGQTAGTIPIRYETDSLDDLPRQIQMVHAVAKQWLVTSGFVGIVAVRDDDPSPKVTLSPKRPVVHYGRDIVFRLRLSKPVDYYANNVVRAVRNDRFRPLRTSDVPHHWLWAQMGSVPADVPLYRVWRYGYVDLLPGHTQARIVVPTRAHPLHNRAKALTIRFSARHLTPPLRATAHVLPAH